MFEQLKFGFNRTTTWNKYQSKVTIQQQNYLTDPSLQGVNRIFMLSFSDNMIRTVHTECFMQSTDIKDYNALIDGQNFLVSLYEII